MYRTEAGFGRPPLKGNGRKARRRERAQYQIKKSELPKLTRGLREQCLRCAKVDTKDDKRTGRERGHIVEMLGRGAFVVRVSLGRNSS